MRMRRERISGGWGVLRESGDDPSHLSNSIVAGRTSHRLKNVETHSPPGRPCLRQVTILNRIFQGAAGSVI